MYNTSVHILKAKEGYGSEKVFAPVIANALCRHQAAVYCMISGVDARLLSSLSTSLPVFMQCVFRLSGEKRLSLIFLAVVAVGAALCVLCVSALSYCIASTVLANATPVLLGTPLTYPISLCMAWYGTLVFASTALGKRWAFALENSMGFCCNEEALSYWCQMKAKRSRSGNITKTNFTVMAVRERQSGTIIRVVLFRLPPTQLRYMHASLLCDAIELARPVECRFSIASVIVCIWDKPPLALIDSHTTDLCSLLQRNSFSTHISADGFFVGASGSGNSTASFERYSEAGLDAALAVHLTLHASTSTQWWKPQKKLSFSLSS